MANISQWSNIDHLSNPLRNANIELTAFFFGTRLAVSHCRILKLILHKTLGGNMHNNTSITEDDLREAAKQARFGDFRLEDLLDCAEEELEISVKTYPGQVARGRLMPNRAISKIAKKKAICDLIAGILEKQKSECTDCGMSNGHHHDDCSFNRLKNVPSEVIVPEAGVKLIF
jgi:hypothetical protein